MKNGKVGTKPVIIDGVSCQYKFSFRTVLRVSDFNSVITYNPLENKSSLKIDNSTIIGKVLELSDLFVISFSNFNLLENIALSLLDLRLGIRRSSRLKLVQLMNKPYIKKLDIELSNLRYKRILEKVEFFRY